MVKHSKPPYLKTSEWKGKKGGEGAFDGAREGLISKELRFKFFFPSKLCPSTSTYKLALANKSKM